MAGAAFGASILHRVDEDSFDRQPLIESNRWLFAADARLDNRDEIVRALGIDGRDLADSSLLFRAWQKWGEGVLDRIAGDFAFALFDARERILVLARDPTGQRPLFYSLANDSCAFATMPNALDGSPAYASRLNREVFAQALSDMPTASDRTYFSAIRKVRPGEIVTISAGVARRRNYWNPPHGPSSWIRAADCEESYRAMLDEVVRSRLRHCSGPVATHLTSGLDSGGVASSAVNFLGKPNLIALTSAPLQDIDVVEPRGRLADESEFARRVAAFLGIRHIVVREKGSAIAHLRSQAALYQQPYRNIINGGWLTHLALAARAEGCSVMLTGESGNVSLNAGSLANLGDMVVAGRWAHWAKEARQAMSAGGARWTGVMLGSFGYLLPRPILSALERRYLFARHRPEATFLRRELVDQFIRPAPTLRHERRSANSYADRLALIRSYDFGNYNKGMLAETGIDARHPYLDSRAIEFSLRTPPTELFHRGRSRSLARRGLAGRLPTTILEMHERGYQAAGWQKHVPKGELFGIVEEIASSTTATELLDIEKLKETAARWEKMDFNDLSVDFSVGTFLPLALAGGLFILEAERGFPRLRTQLHQ